MFSIASIFRPAIPIIQLRLAPRSNNLSAGRYSICGRSAPFEVMKVNDPNLAGLANTGATSGTTSGLSRAQEAEKTSQSSVAGRAAGGAGSGDDVHLSELVRSLRSMAADSPERQANIEQIARSFAGGSYQVNAHATAGKVISDAHQK
jgi:flagellar biosynthesis anti-sigma factor FlgM